MGKIWSEIKMAGVPGFEPGIPIPKTGALPLGHPPTILNGDLPLKDSFVNQKAKIRPTKVKWCRNQDSNPGPDDYKL